ncbi:MAG TPA: ABC transporter ATP-binding protein, partial [Chloroflexi bacterium]|nr:ABC transporter ATP-binding protein [Chloroflexota bacterium]
MGAGFPDERGCGREDQRRKIGARRKGGCASVDDHGPRNRLLMRLNSHCSPQGLQSHPGRDSLSVADASSLLLEVEGLRTHFRLPRGIVRAVDGVDFFIRRGEAYGLVGESGSGKTVTALSIMGLIEPPGEVVADKIRFDGLALLELDEAGWASLRGDRICLIFQDPQVRLNPVFSIGSQLAEVLQIHRG